MSESFDEIVPPLTGTARKRRRRRRTALVAVVVLVLAGAVWGGTTIMRSCGTPWSGVSVVDDDCIGVTDGSYEFHPELAHVQEKIAAENARVREATSDYVTLVLVDPLTATARGGLPAEQVRNRLEGAYTALRRVNTTAVAGDASPQIQLLLANQGTSEQQWREVTEEIIDLSTRDNPVVGVIGLGISAKHTQQQAAMLSRHGIPMVGAYLTADGFDYERIPGLVKTSPSNRHYVEALRQYLTAETDIDSAILVRDSNSDAGLDLYTQTLERQFQRQMADMLHFPTQQFAGSSLARTAEPNLFAGVRASICAAAAEGLRAVLYAGREVDLAAFLDSLEQRTCYRLPLTILTAGLELGDVLRGSEDELADANLTIISAATVDAEGWRANQDDPDTPEYYGDFRTAFEKHFHGDHLDDGGAIMMHDALLTAASAIRLAAPEGAASAPTARDVRAQLLNLNVLHEVQGGSGTLTFSKQERGTGVPVGKPVPVLRYPHPDESATRQVGSLYLVTN
ncbi:hypothetical protein FFT09_09550 [Saccharomonospora piscinae]|uniref:ABC transporter substrate-binding protein n=1 Tax=Saccharomonospora piscinae TaxID=687388 RepID=UPI001106B471|nr:hypothetical protein [Saccharomonospora piscinae]TLW93608.1 hypothetical protein FFT09_09550 [Saccharomonospora piscinae]